jgi:glycosyltransferase involved in cell wall biosynthesis
VLSTGRDRGARLPGPGSPPVREGAGQAPQPVATRANVAAVIPAYAEERHIRDVATRARAYLDVVLVVDDGSPDRTAAQARAARVEVLRHPANAGKGAAIKTGLRALMQRPGTAFVLVLDGDGQHLPEEIPRLMEAANATGAAMVVGTRMGDRRAMPLPRMLTNQVMSWTISRVIGQPVPDSQCGFRLFARSLFTPFAAMPSSRYDIETEMLAIAARNGHRIAAAPVSTIYGDQVSQIAPGRDTLRFLRLLGRLMREAPGRSPAAATAPPPGRRRTAAGAPAGAGAAAGAGHPRRGGDG